MRPSLAWVAGAKHRGMNEGGRPTGKEITIGGVGYICVYAAL
jgi:hypothetical protein